jgi:hypothetical protein
VSGAYGRRCQRRAERERGLCFLLGGIGKVADLTGPSDAADVAPFPDEAPCADRGALLHAVLMLDSVLKRIMEISEEAYRNFQRHVDRLCFLIVASDCPVSEIEIERLHLRVQAMGLFPENIPLYDMIYESRFRRLREQFRCSNDR